MGQGMGRETEASNMQLQHSIQGLRLEKWFSNKSVFNQKTKGFTVGKSLFFLILHCRITMW